MQTLKTAAIVVLLFVVMYSAWVSMTAPPQEMSPELVDLVASDQEFSIEDGFGDSPGFEINTGVAESLAFDSAGVAGDAASGSVPPSFAADPGISWSGSDTNPSGADYNNTLAGSADASSDAMNGERIASTDSVGISAITASAVMPSNDYPSTGGTFSMPSPEEAAATFGPAPEGTPAFAPVDSSTVSVEQSGGGSAVPGSSSESPVSVGFENALKTADAQYAADQRKEALATLSLFYNAPELTEQQRVALNSRLDPLAREVIYGDRHLLEQPRRVQARETLMDIAREYEVPWQLLQNINGVQDPILMTPGTDLKVIRGPFRTEVDLTTNELTLFLGDLYAGRFEIAVGNDPAPKEGTYTIQDKLLAKTFYDKSGLPIPPGSPSNPYGSMWIDLGDNLSIHGSPSPTRPTTAGCISVRGDYAKDLAAILSQGSSVTIRR